MIDESENSSRREELQDEVTRHWPDSCGGCGRPTHEAKFNVDITESGQILYSCSGCPVNTYVTPDPNSNA